MVPTGETFAYKYVYVAVELLNLLVPKVTKTCRYNLNNLYFKYLFYKFPWLISLVC